MPVLCCLDYKGFIVWFHIGSTVNYALVSYAMFYPRLCFGIWGLCVHVYVWECVWACVCCVVLCKFKDILFQFYEEYPWLSIESAVHFEQSVWCMTEQHWISLHIHDHVITFNASIPCSCVFFLSLTECLKISPVIFMKIMFAHDCYYVQYNLFYNPS